METLDDVLASDLNVYKNILEIIMNYNSTFTVYPFVGVQLVWSFTN